MRGPAVLLLAFLAVAPGLAAAAEPEPMVVQGRALANGRPLPEGVPLSAYAGERGPYGTAPVGPDGAFSLAIPPDDPRTPEREGPAKGERLAFFAQGAFAEPLPIAFVPGGAEEADLTFRLPDPAIASASAPEGAREGREARVKATLANRGDLDAEGVRVRLLEDGQVVDERVVDRLPARGTRSVELRAPTDRPGNRSLLLAVAGGNGDLDPADSTFPLTLRVAWDAGPEVRLRHEPAAPSSRDPVLLVAEASDPDGVGTVTIYWDAGEGLRSREVAWPPYQVALDPLPAGTTVEYSAVATDYGPLRRMTVTPTQTLQVRAPDPAAPDADPTPDAPPEARTRDARTPGLPLPALGAALLLALLARRRGRA